ncbi:MAG: hypothetical protein ACO3FK_01655 [Vulcanococcus sp.]|jgi:hypothetical protein
MQPHWHKLRWPITALALGSMAYAGLLHITRHPLEVRLVHSFAEPLRLAGRVDAQLNMPQPVQIEPIRAMTVKVSEQAPINLSVSNKTPVQVQVSNPDPIQIKVDENQPMQLDVQPQGPVKVKVGL